MALGFAQKKTNFLVLQNRLFCVDGSLPTCLPLRLQGGAADLLSTKVNFVDFAGVGDVFEGVGVQDDEVGIFPRCHHARIDVCSFGRIPRGGDAIQAGFPTVAAVYERRFSLKNA